MNLIQLTAQVNARNKVNQHCNELYPLLIKALAPFVGQKVTRADNSLTLKVKTVLPVYERKGLRWHVSIDGSGLSLVMDICEPYGDHSNLYQNTYAVLYFFESYNNGILGKVFEHQKTQKTDYAIDAILAKRKELEEARKKVRDIESELCPFN